MIEGAFIFIGFVFALAGFVKGIVGLGLPTIAMGPLAVIMPPVEAAALLVIPSLFTNAWQMAAGPSLPSVVRRLWAMMLAICLGTWAGAGLMTGVHTRHGTLLLGIALALYALSGLAAIRFTTPREWEAVCGPVAGAVTGIITAATGVFVLPAVQYLQSIGLEKEELVQALGLSFTVSTMALAVNVWVAGALTISMAGATMVALVFAGVGMWAGQLLRQHLTPDTFRRCFFLGLLILALYLIARSLV